MTFTPRYQIGLPSGATGFASSPIPSITLDKWEVIPRRAPLTQRTLARYSQYGTGQVQGPGHSTKYLWSVTYKFPKDTVRQLESLREYQQETGLPIRLIDEVEYLPSELAPHSRELLVPIEESWNPSYEYGYGVFNVWLTFSNDYKEFFAVQTDDQELYTVTFSMTEM